MNLETAVTNGGAPTTKEFVFRAPPTAFAALAAGASTSRRWRTTTASTTASQGLRDSLAAAKRYRFPVIGIGLDDEQAYRPFRRTVNGQRIAVIGATQVLDDELISAWTAGPGKPGLASAKDVPRLLRAVRAARATSDTVVVFLHWGVELAAVPVAGPARAREAARRRGRGRRRRRARASRPGRRPHGRCARRLRPRQLRLVRDERALDADRRAARTVDGQHASSATAGCPRGSSTGCRAR